MGLYDRDYMRDDENGSYRDGSPGGGPKKSGVIVFIAIAVLVAFVLAWVLT